jgi:triphosphatase
MSKEIELKLRLSPPQARRLLAHPLLAGETPQKFRLLNTYYDTPDFDLRQRGIAVRMRRKGWAVWLMTVKVAASGAGGLAQRSEWEAPTQPGVFDFDIVTEAPLREFLHSHQAQLHPVFTTDFTRTAWTLKPSAALIELALDRGRISAPGAGQAPQSEALCELELELLEGESPDPLFDLAIALAAGLQLHPEIASKAERGYALADPVPVAPVKALVSPVINEMSPVEAFRAIALSCLMQLQGNEAGAIAGNDPEFVHQARVAIRRLRSAFNLFAPVLNPRFVEVYSPRWLKLARGLGSARDWDVFLTETLAPLEEAFPGDADLAVETAGLQPAAAGFFSGAVSG